MDFDYLVCSRSRGERSRLPRCRISRFYRTVSQDARPLAQVNKNRDLLQCTGIEIATVRVDATPPFAGQERQRHRPGQPATRIHRTQQFDRCQDLIGRSERLAAERGEHQSGNGARRPLMTCHE